MKNIYFFYFFLNFTIHNGQKCVVKHVFSKNKNLIFYFAKILFPPHQVTPTSAMIEYWCFFQTEKENKEWKENNLSLIKLFVKKFIR